MSSDTLAPRFNRCRPLIGVSNREDGRAGGLQIGFTTYGTDADTGRETYQVTYLEWGGRSDHLTDALAKATGVAVEPQFVDEANADDVAYVGTPEMNAAFQKEAQPAPAKAVKVVAPTEAATTEVTA